MPGAAIGGRALGAVPFDGRKLGAGLCPPEAAASRIHGARRHDGRQERHCAAAASVRVPRANFAHAARLLARQARTAFDFRRGRSSSWETRWPRGCFTACERRAVEVCYQNRLSELIEHEGNEITGAVMSTPDGDIAIRARKGVVLATGGIGWSGELRERLFPEAPLRFSLGTR